MSQVDVLCTRSQRIARAKRLYLLAKRIEQRGWTWSDLIRDREDTIEIAHIALDLLAEAQAETPKSAE
jgi:hypothetical protein